MALNKRNAVIGLGMLATAFAANTPADAQYGPSPLVSEDQLMELGCGLTNRNFERGTLDYECDSAVLSQIAPSGYGAGPRCSIIGRDWQIVVFRCRENISDYDRDYPRPGRDYRAPRQTYPFDPFAPRR